MNDIKIEEYETQDLSDTTMLVTFPTIGLVGPIAGNFLIDALKLKEIGRIRSSFFMPATVIHDGKPSPPVRIYLGEKVCESKPCEQIGLIISEFNPPPQLIQPLAQRILTWAGEKNIKRLVGLEGVRSEKKDENEDATVYAVGSTKEVKQWLEQFPVEPTKEGFLTGINGVLLYEGLLQNQDVVCITTESALRYPDARSAAHLLEKLDKMLPQIPLDLEPLYKQAEDLEEKIKILVERQKKMGSYSPTPTEPSMYH